MCISCFCSLFDFDDLTDNESVTPPDGDENSGNGGEEEERCPRRPQCPRHMPLFLENLDVAFERELRVDDLRCCGRGRGRWLRRCGRRGYVSACFHFAGRSFRQRCL